MNDSTLLDIFLTQAVTTLELLRRDDIESKRRTRAIDDFLGAAELVGTAEILEEASTVAKALADGDTRLLSGLIEQIKEELAEAAEDSFDSEPTTENPVLDRSAPRPKEDSAKTLVRPSPTSSSSKFDTAEHIHLLTFFREEAHESLERVTSLLLGEGSQTPSDQVLDELMRTTHQLKGSAGTVDLPLVADMTHELEGIFESIRLGRRQWTLPMRDHFVEITDLLRDFVNSAASSSEEADSSALRRAMDELKRGGKTPPPTPANQEAASPRGERVRRETAPLVILDGQNSEGYAERRRPDRRGSDSPMLRVEPARIDHLMNSVGELIFDRTRIEKSVNSLTGEVHALLSAARVLGQTRAGWRERESSIRADEFEAALNRIEEQLERSLPEMETVLRRLRKDTDALRRTEFSLQDGLTGVRMQSVRSLFQRLTPQLRNIARNLNRQVKLVTAGGETEFDKTVADQLVDPLVQLLRNAVAHGIEDAATRQASGKSPEGRITVTARHEGNVVVLEVGDDGCGINTEALRKRLVSTGRWSEARAESASDERVLRSIFEAGTSSKTETDQFSGRGVGLSSVRETITRLGGEVLVSSVRGRGTTFTLRLPLTTSIANALLFKVGGNVFAVPNVHVLDQSIVELPLEEELVSSEGERVPVVSLHGLLGIPLPPSTGRIPVVQLQYLGHRFVITADKIVGTREIVVKNLGPLLSRLPLYAGGTISPSGKVQLILDPAALVREAYPSYEPTKAGEREPSVAKKVLVVDDSKAIREAMRHMLQRAGYRVATADNGRSAWQTLIEEGCDMIVTDLEMPIEDGFALLERLRSDRQFTNLPAIVISSKANDENRRRAQELQVFEFMPKPVSQQKLVDALRAMRRELRE